MKNKIKIPAILIGLASTALVFSSFVYLNNKPFNILDWVVPETAKKVKNPVKPAADNLKTGKELFDLHCKSCHGSKGKGDGVKAKSLNTPCGDFTDKGFQAQTDGSIFYKIKEGKDDMPSYKKKITDELDVWSIVNYIRTFAPATAATQTKTTPPAEEKKKVTETEVKKTVTDTVKKVEKPVVQKKDSLTAVKDSLALLEKSKIMMVISKFEKAFNNSDTSALPAFFSSNGVYMPLLGNTAIGSVQIKGTFKKLFLLNKYMLKFTIDELEQDADIYLVRASFTGDHTTIINNQKTTESGRSLMVLKKINGEWKIYQCMMN